MSVYVRPESPGATHHISLQGGGRIWGVKLKRGARSIVESALTPSNIEKGGGGGKRFGDFDPSFAHIEMRDWSGGRGSEFFSNDPTQYYDGYGWTLTPGVWHQAPQWSWGEMSTLTGDVLMPGANRFDVGRSMSWQSFTASTVASSGDVIYGRSFTQSSGAYDIKRVQTWIRRFGVPPAPLRVLATTDASTTGISSASSNLTTLGSTGIEALESVVWNATLTSAVAQDGSTTKAIWVYLWTTQAGTVANHWEIGYNTSAASNSSATRGNGSTRVASTVNFYFRTAPAKIAKRGRRWKLFEMERATYAVSMDADGSSSLLLINGVRGKHSSAVAGTTDAFHCNTISSEASYLVGATLAIIKGTGSGLEAPITAVAASSGADGGAKLSVSLDQAPSSADSEMVIHDTNHWESVVASSAVGDAAVKDVMVAGDVAYFAFGNSTFIGTFYWNSSVHENLKNTTAIKPDYFHNFQVSSENRIYGAISSDADIYYGKSPTTKGSSIAFSTASSLVSAVGSSDYPFTNLTDYGGFLYAAKEDSLWVVKDQRAEKVNIGLDAFPSSNNGRSLFTQNLLLHLSWSHSLERLYQGTLDDIGPWRGAGLKPGHQGPISASVPVIAWSFHSIDAGTTGRSAIMAWDGTKGWHEIHRAYSTGYRMQEVHFQNNAGARPRMWFSEGGELISMPFPKDTLNPRNDKDIHYQHESVLETATVDMGATQLKKLFYGLDAHTQSLASSISRIYVEYQLDDNIRSTRWTPMGQFYRSPQDELFIRRGDKHAIRFRFRAVTQNSTVPSELLAATLKAVGRTPVKRLWNIEAKAGDFQVDSQGLRDSDPDKFYAWLREAAESNQPILMRSVWSAMDNIYVFSEHPILNRTFTTPEGEWGGVLRLAIREL